MQAFAIVKHLDVFEGRGLDLRMDRVADPMHAFVLEAIEPALCWRVVPTVTLPAHRADHAVFPEHVLENDDRIRATPVGVMNQARRWPLPEPAHGQGIGNEIGRQAWLQVILVCRPALVSSSSVSPK